jgi:hypothetical protein
MNELPSMEGRRKVGNIRTEVQNKNIEYIETTQH